MRFLTLMNRLEEMTSLRERFEEKYGKFDAHIHFAGNAISYYDALMKQAEDINSMDQVVDNPFAFLRDECDKISDLKMHILEKLNWADSGLLVENEVINSRNELVFVANFVNEKLEKLNFGKDRINPNNPLQVTTILIQPQGTTACSYFAQIEPLDERFISILPPDTFQDPTRHHVDNQSNPFLKYCDVPEYDYNLSFSGDVFDYHSKQKVLARKLDEHQVVTKGSNLKKILKRTLIPAALTGKDIELSVGYDTKLKVLFDADFYEKADIIAVASFSEADELAGIKPNEMLNPCKIRGMYGVEETIKSGEVRSVAAARVNLVFLKNGKSRIMQYIHEVRV